MPTLLSGRSVGSKLSIPAVALLKAPTLGVRLPKIKTTGWRTWTEEDIAAFEAKHPIGTQARLAMALMLGANASLPGVAEVREAARSVTTPSCEDGPACPTS